MKKLLVLALVMGIASLANAAVSYTSTADTASVLVSGEIQKDIYVIYCTDAAIASEALVTTKMEASSYQASAADFGVTTYANGSGYALATFVSTFPVTDNYLSVGLTLIDNFKTGSRMTVTGTSSTQTVTGSYTNQTILVPPSPYVETEVVAGGTWYRTYNDVLNEVFNTVLTEYFESQLTESWKKKGANFQAQLMDAGTMEYIAFGSEEILGTEIITGSQSANVKVGESSSDLLVDSFTQKVLIGEYFVAIPEPATMALLGLGALVLRRKK